MPDRFKVGVIKSLLKNSGADHENFSNFCPVSNCICYLKSPRKQLQHNYVIILMLTRVSSKNFNQRANGITVLRSTQRQYSENICSEDLRSRIFEHLKNGILIAHF